MQRAPLVLSEPLIAEIDGDLTAAAPSSALCEQPHMQVYV